MHFCSAFGHSYHCLDTLPLPGHRLNFFKFQFPVSEPGAAFFVTYLHDRIGRCAAAEIGFGIIFFARFYPETLDGNFNR